MQTAQTWARTELRREYSDLYREIYLIELSEFINLPDFKSNTKRYRAMAESKAKTKLTYKYRDRYKELYNLAVTRGYLRKFPRRV